MGSTLVRLVTPPPALSVERAALVDAIKRNYAASDRLDVLRRGQRNLEDRRIAADAALALGLGAHQEAQDAAAGQLVAEAMGATVTARALSICDAREEVAECRAQLEAIAAASENIGRQAADAETESSAALVEVQNAVWSVIRSDPKIAALRQLRADIEASVKMVKNIGVWPDGPDPAPDPGIADRWLGAHLALIADPSAELPAILTVPEGI